MFWTIVLAIIAAMVLYPLFVLVLGIIYGIYDDFSEKSINRQYKKISDQEAEIDLLEKQLGVRDE